MSTSGVSNIKQLPDLVNLIYSEKKEGIVLDIGCGRGILGYLIKVLFPDKYLLTGLDPDIPQKVLTTVTSIYENIYESTIEDFLKDPSIFNSYIAVANHVFEHIIEEKALSIIEELKEHSEMIILGFPNPRSKYVYNLFSEDYHTHKWGASSSTMNKVGFSKVHEIKGNEVFIWKS